MTDCVVRAIFVVHKSLETLDNIVLSIQVSIACWWCGDRARSFPAIDLGEHIGQSDLTLCFDKGSDPTVILLAGDRMLQVRCKKLT